jgi:hypothetical protein
VYALKAKECVALEAGLWKADLMWSLRKFCLQLIMGAFVCSAYADKKPPLPDAAAVFRRAVEGSDIWSAGPIRMKLNVKLLQVKAGEIDAAYEKTWISAKQWRSQFTSEGFNEITVGGDGEVWNWSDSPEKPLRVHQFERALAALSQAPLNAVLKYTARAVPLKDQKKKLICVVVDDKQRSLVEDCVDPDTGLLTQARDIQADLIFEYSDYKPFKGKQFPTTIGVIEGSRRPVAVAKVVGFEETPTVPASLFEPPATAISYKACSESLGFPLGVSGGKLVKQVNPIPRLPRSNRPIIYYSTTVFGIVGRDGNLHSLVMVSSGNNLAGDEILQAVRQWRYEPFTVCGNPMEVPTAITVNLN